MNLSFRYDNQFHEDCFGLTEIELSCTEFLKSSALFLKDSYESCLRGVLIQSSRSQWMSIFNIQFSLYIDCILKFGFSFLKKNCQVEKPPDCSL